MGTNSSRGWTYLFVLAAVGTLIYAVYITNSAKRTKSPAYDSASLNNGSASNVSNDTSLYLTSPAALHADSMNRSVTGNLAKGVSSAASSTVAGVSELTNYGTQKVRRSVSSSPEIITTEDPSLTDKSPSISDPIASSTKTRVTTKGVHLSKHVKKKQKFNPGSEKGDFMVVAGNFASKDNADALIGKLKKMGFAKAEIVKLDNSATLHVIAGSYSYKGGAEAALRTLKAHKVAAFVKKKSGDIYKSTTPSSTASVQPS